MIKVFKPALAPDKLAIDGKTLTEQMCADYEASQHSSAAIKFEFSINSGISNHPIGKKILKNSQHNKCCFCEKEQLDEYGAVEHYRPKNGYRSAKGEEIKKPGYNLLGYNWSNLYFVCWACNTYKSYFFPIVDETKRATWHGMNIVDETRLLLEPAGNKDPREHIVFDYHLPRGITEYGKRTIEICKLNRDDLNEKRKNQLSSPMLKT